MASAYQDEVMATSRFVAVGCGGSAAFLDDLARTGIGEIVLIDPDVVEPPNASTQQAYLDEVGRPKVEALGARLVRANLRLRVHTVHASLDDLDDAAMRRLCLESLPRGMTAPPQAVVLGAFTDDFHAQARVARLGLHLKVATIAGLVYAEGHGVEVTFAAAGVTPACQRCVQSRRYAAYLDQGFRNDIGSAGSPISATMRLNALAPLSDGEMAVRDLHDARVGTARSLGALLVRDIEVAHGRLGAKEGQASYTTTQIEGAINEIRASDPQSLTFSAGLRDQLDQLKTLLDSRAGSGQQVDLKPLRDIATLLRQTCSDATVQAESDAGASGETDDQSAVARPAAGGSGQLRSRQDAISTLADRTRQPGPAAHQARAALDWRELS